MSAKITARYCRARPAFARALGFDPGAIVRIEPGWGDRHRRGQTVARVTLDSGTRLAYKPRSVQSELLWATVVNAVERHLGLGLAAPRVLDRGNHGWVEWVEAEPVLIDSSPVLRRVGAVVALLDLLEVRDAHPANFVWSRGQPILVDAETVAHPRLLGFEEVPSIILTGVLPWPPGGRKRALLSELAVSLAREAAIIAGYRAVHRIVRRLGSRWLARAGVLGRFRGIRIRVVLRPSRIYAAAFRQGGEKLSPPPGIVNRAGAERIHAAERRALARGDIPLFETDLDGTDLRDDERVIAPGFFGATGWGIMADRMKQLGTDDARRSVGLLRSCLRLDQAVRGRR